MPWEVPLLALLFAAQAVATEGVEPEPSAPAEVTLALDPVAHEDTGGWYQTAGGVVRCDALTEADNRTVPTERAPRGTRGCGWLQVGDRDLAAAIGKKGGRWFVVDSDGDGAWSDETPIPTDWDDELDDHVGWFTHSLEVAHEGDAVPVDVAVRLLWDKRYLKARWATARTDRLGEREVKLTAFAGRFDLGSASVSIDVDGDGELRGLERRAVSAGWFRIDGVDYALSVDPAGEVLTLTPGDRPGPILELGAPAPGFELADLAGDTQSLDAHSGRWVLLDFWATWCGPCVAGLPDLEALATERADVLDVVGIAPDEADRLAPFCEDRGLTHPQIPIEWGDPVMEAYQVNGVPTYVLVDPDGLLAEVGSLERIGAHLAAALAD